MANWWDSSPVVVPQVPTTPASANDSDQWWSGSPVVGSPRLVPVDHDPWAPQNIPAPPPGFVLQSAPADGNSSSGQGPDIPAPPPGFKLVPVDHDPFAEPYGAPPPGVIIHGATTDSISDRPDLSIVRPSDNGGDRNTAIQDMALLKRASSGLDSTRALAPTFQGVSLGGGDEAVSAAAAAIAAAKGNNFQDNYDVNQAAQKQVLDRQFAEHPYLSAGGQLAGALLPGLGGAALASSGARILGGGILPVLGANGVVGAGMGAIQGALSADPGNRLAGAKTGGEWGGGLGVAAVPVGSVVGKLVGAGARKVIDAYYGLMHGGIVPGQAAKSLVANLARQGDTVSSALQKQADLGPGAVLADTGPAAQGLAARMATTETDVSPQMAQNLAARADQFAPRINSAVDSAAGPDINAPAQMSALKATTAANGAANYAKAAANTTPIDVTPVIAQIDSQVVPSQMAGNAMDPISSALLKARSYIAGNNFSKGSLEVLHRAQDAIDDAASSAFRSGDNAQARALWGVRTKLLNQMDAANPEYAAARSQYASDKSIENAFENGRSIFAPRVDGKVYDPDLLESRLASMSQPEKDAFQLGTRKALTDTMGQARTDAAGVKTRLANENGYATQKLRQVIGDPQTDSLLKELDSQAAMQATNNAALNGSKTAMATAADADIPQPKLLNQAGAAAGGHGGGALSGVLIGEQLATSLGLPPVLGSVAGLPVSWLAGKGSRMVADAINSGRAAANTVARSSMAQVLTSPAQKNVMDALLAYERSSPVASAMSEKAKMIARAMMMEGGANGQTLAPAIVPRPTRSFQLPW
ncbi:hypothetical protein [Mesorhizobium huakuii]|uniref:Uncharacterized protein n=1 Tax=Mesorhizobium huakuii TaxID=28104 RepID=A0A7G6SSC1_9HYPH|nr:hypothetical protein [Mesorhizobium huakuii]QND57403.1 hypothetical protein HB778_12835 [Mesorhizobium huakuii]